MSAVSSVLKCLGIVFYLLFLESCLLNANKSNWKSCVMAVIITSVLVWRL